MSSFSKHFQRWAVDSTSIFMGMQENKISTHLMYDLLRHNQDSGILDPKYDFFSFDGPMHTVWFDPWKKHLEENGVTFRMNHEVTKMDYTDDRITSVSVRDMATNDRAQRFEADIFVNGLDVKSLVYVYPTTSFALLYDLSKQIQTQVMYHLSYRLPERFNTVYIFGDSPWFLMTRQEGNLWETCEEDYLSCGIGMWSAKGLNGKTALECTPEELAEECWAQMKQSDGNFFQEEVPTWNVWDSFKYKDGELTTYEPKFSNNVGTLELRPHSDDEIFSNLYHATAYTRTGTNIFNMDSAAEAGLRAVNAITGNNDVKVRPVYKPNWFFRMMQKLYRLCCMKKRKK